MGFSCAYLRIASQLTLAYAVCVSMGDPKCQILVVCKLTIRADLSDRVSQLSLLMLAKIL